MRNFKLGVKIGGGFGLLVLVSLVLGGLAVFNMSHVETLLVKLQKAYVAELGLVGQLERRAQRTMYDIRGYALSEDRNYLKAGRENLAKVKESLAESKDLVSRYPFLVKLKAGVGKVEELVNAYDRLVNDTAARDDGIDAARLAMDRDALGYMNACKAYLQDEEKKLDQQLQTRDDPVRQQARARKVTQMNQVMALGNDIRVKNFKAQALRDHALLREALKDFEVIFKIVDELTSLSTQELNTKQLSTIKTAAVEYQKAMGQFLEHWDAMDRLSKQRNQVGAELLELTRQISLAGMEGMRAISAESTGALNLANWVMVIGLIVALLISVLAALFITRSITMPVVATVRAVGKAAEGDFTFTL